MEFGLKPLRRRDAAGAAVRPDQGSGHGVQVEPRDVERGAAVDDAQPASGHDDTVQRDAVGLRLERHCGRRRIRRTRAKASRPDGRVAPA